MYIHLYTTLQIARLFCQEPLLQPFHRHFLSCNEPVYTYPPPSTATTNTALTTIANSIPLVKGSELYPMNSATSQYSIDWCMKCEKCCFIYLLLSAWLSPVYINTIFTTQLFTYTTLIPIYIKLVGGDKQEKSFECVGTFTEASAAVELTVYRYLFSLQQQREQQRGKGQNYDPYDRWQDDLPIVLVELIEYLKIDCNVLMTYVRGEGGGGGDLSLLANLTDVNNDTNNSNNNNNNNTDGNDYSGSIRREDRVVRYIVEKWRLG